jgi:transcriptional regulator with XRE-family HTH domain
MSQNNGGEMKSKIDIGPKIKIMRLEKGLKLKDVAKETGLSIGLISKVENNNASPSLSTLIKMANFLGTDASFFLEGAEKKENAVVCRKEDRKVWTSNDDKIYFELLNPSPLRNKKVEVVYARIERFESPDEKYTHEGEEFGLVLKGHVHVDLENKTYLLTEGDSIYFKSTVPHAIYCANSEPAEAIWVNSPPIKIL